MARENCIRRPHQANHGNPISKTTRFYKVMRGNDYEKLMELPAVFAPTLENMARQIFHLTDSDGDDWPVVLSRVEGRLSFTTGWPLFFKYHNLEEGSLLTFEHTEGRKSLFVHVYEKNGIEAVYEKAPDVNGTKSSPENKIQGSDLNAAEEKSSEADDDTKRKRVPTPPPEANMSMEKEIESDVGSVDEVIELEGDSDFDSPADKPAKDFVNLEKASAFEANASGSKAFSGIGVCGKRKTKQEMMEKNRNYHKASGSKMQNFFRGINMRRGGGGGGGEPAEKAKKSLGFNINTPKFGSKVQSKARENRFVAKYVLKNHCDRSAKEVGGSFNKLPDFISKPKERSNGHKRSAKMMESEGIDEATDVRRRGKRPIRAHMKPPTVKVEPESPSDDHQNRGSFTVVVESLEFLELPHGVRGFWTFGHIINLEGPNGREYPVLCEVYEVGNVLAAKWKKFCRKNDIHEGDTCRFEHHEDSRLKLYRVYVER